jgi:hypothetical protein
MSIAIDFLLLLDNAFIGIDDLLDTYCTDDSLIDENRILIFKDRSVLIEFPVCSVGDIYSTIYEVGRTETIRNDISQYELIIWHNNSKMVRLN